MLVAPAPAAYTEIDRFNALSGKCWNVVAISNGRIYARSTTEGVCLDVSAPVPRVELQVPAQDAASIARDGFRFLLTSDTPGLYAIEWSEDLTAWTLLKSVDYASGALEVVDTASANPSTRYYRAHR